MLKLVSTSIRSFAFLAAGLLLSGLASCSQSTHNARQQTPPPAMEYEQRQREVAHLRQALEQGGDTSPAALCRYTEDKPEDLRRDLYALFWQMGTASQAQPKRAQFVEFMLSRTPAETPLLRGQLLKWLQDFRKEDFNQNTIITLTALPWTPDYCPEVIRLIGIAGVPQAMPKLKAQVKDQPLPEPPPPGYQNSNTWAALLALARQGDDQALTAVIQRVREEQDIIVRATVLFYDLGYTRRSAAFDALRVYLNSDKRLPAVKDTVPGRLEACHAAAVFSKHIKGFPIQETDFTEQQVIQVRPWVNAQTEWRFK